MPTTVTRTVAPSGGDHTTLNAALSWFTTNYPDFTASDIIGAIVISGDWTSAADTTPANATGITTDATRYLDIYTTGGARHSGVWSNSAYRLEVTASYGIRFGTNTNGIHVTGLQIYINTASPAASMQGIYANATGALSQEISNCLIRGNTGWNTASYIQNGVQVYHSSVTTSGTVKIWNNIIYDFVNPSGTARGIYGQSFAGSTSTIYSYNNTVHSCRSGIDRSAVGSFIIVNTAVSDCTNNIVGNYEAGTDYNATDDASLGYTVSGSGNTHDVLDAVIVWNNEAGDDFHLVSGDDIIDVGTSDPGTGLFSDDIDGVTRSGTWDIGADEYVSAPSGPIMLGRYMFIARSDGTSE